MEQQNGAHEMFGQIAGRMLDTMSVWADANQRLLRELMELSSGTAQEGLRLSSEIQRNAIDAIRQSQGTPRWQPALRFFEESGQAATRAAERLQASAEQAGKGIQGTLAGAVTKMKEICAA